MATMRQNIFFFTVLVPLSLSCSDGPLPELRLWAFKDCQEHMLIVSIENDSSMPVFVPNNSWLYDLNDTLLIEAVYKKYNETDLTVFYNQFSPPELIEIKSGTRCVRSINFENLDLNMPKQIRIRIFVREYNLTHENDYEKYHSLKSFYEFEKINSFTLTAPVDSLTAVGEW
jgi:hypothetical protein